MNWLEKLTLRLIKLMQWFNKLTRWPFKLIERLNKLIEQIEEVIWWSQVWSSGYQLFILAPTLLYRNDLQFWNHSPIFGPKFGFEIEHLAIKNK